MTDQIEDPKDYQEENQPETQELELQEPQDNEDSQDRSENQDQKAKQYGHISKEEWERQGRDPSKWKSPEQFNEFGDSYSKLRPHIDTLKKEISKRDAALDTIIEHINEVKYKEYLRGKSEVEARLQQAREMGDIESVENLTRQRTELDLREQQTKMSDQLQSQQLAEAQFIERNKHWYNEAHQDMVVKAQQMAKEIRSFYPNDSFEAITQKIESRMKFEHPELDLSRAPTPPSMPHSRSSVNKSSMDATPDNEDRMYRTMSADDKADYQFIKRMTEKVPGIKYSIKEYIERSKQTK